MPEDTSSKKIDEATDSLNTKKFYVLLLFVTLMGIIGALMMIAFMFLRVHSDFHPVERHSC